MLKKYLRLFTRVGTDPLVDISLKNEKQDGIALDFDYLYMAQHYPFVNFFLLMLQTNESRDVTGSVAIVTPYDMVGPVDEIQEVSFDIVRTAGGFTLTYDTFTTPTLAFDATGADVQAALRDHPPLATVDVVSNATGYLVSFTGIASPLTLTVTEVSLVNFVAPEFELQYWDGFEWRDCVDVLDSSYGLTENGVLQYSLKNDYSWQKIEETELDDSNIPPELQGLNINNCHWLRVRLTEAPNPATRIKKITYAFTTTETVNAEDKEAPSYYESIRPGKTNWTEEIIEASQEMVHDLKRIGFIKSEGQIIEFDDLHLACAWKTLARIYFNLGRAFRDQRYDMIAKYEKALSSRALTLDKDMDGRINANEINATESRMTR